MADPRTLDDLYGELGVTRTASRAEIAAAFRARAKELHPDAHPGDAAAAEQFKRVGAAYRVLTDPEARARYDRSVRSRPSSSPSAPPSPTAPPSAGPRTGPSPAAPPAARGSARPPSRGSFRLTRRTARWAAGGGVVLVLLGIAMSVFVISLQRHDSVLRSRGVAAVATVVEVNGERRLRFVGPGGHAVVGEESVKSGEEQPAVGTQVAIHYDRSDPTNVVTDQSHAARDITLWIVAVKFMVGGVVLVWFGTRRLRRA